jgi:hypothetical protein
MCRSQVNFWDVLLYNGWEGGRGGRHMKQVFRVKSVLTTGLHTCSLQWLHLTYVAISVSTNMLLNYVWLLVNYTLGTEIPLYVRVIQPV